MRAHFIVAVSLACGICAPCWAVESWADPRLPVTEGLSLWLDASRVMDAARAHGDIAPADRQEIATWYDASGQHRDAHQPAKARRPQLWTSLVKPDSEPVLYFDGQADGMTVSDGFGTAEQVTAFVVAAPYSDLGRFRGIFSFNEAGKNDYQTGINIDLGKDSATRWAEVNVEGAGFSGERNLLSAPLELGTFHALTVRAGTDGQVRLFVDGRAQGARPRSNQPLRADEIRIAMREYGEGNAPPVDGSFIDGCIAEVLVYRRALPDVERQQIESYLLQKHAGLLKLTGPPAKPLVQMLLPGFTVRELPVKLTNINCVSYGPDGLLYALAYDGRIFVLRDTKGDGVEDEARVWWDQPTLRTPIAMAWRPEGLYVVSNGKISLLRDSTGSGHADREEIVVTDWPKDDGHTGGNVDALGIAFDRQNNLYFGLGCADYSNPYRVQDDRAHYDIHSERGTILKVSPDRKHREIVCTGIRFPYAIGFNRAGDLFCTDQEGETWCPGGNPLDELDYIIPARHYGFPPRNEKYLPYTHDEPPVVAFGPQHQSTCGFVFDEPQERQPLFGPKLWEGDAIVAGFSRGKLWRARLAKTSTGYLGRETLLASLRMLTLSPAISPTGDLVIACHGGLPDWGSGPKGAGKLFKIHYADRDAPQPVLAWAQSPVEVHVAFDRPIARDWIDEPNIRITYGQFVRAGDRFEAFRPGYATVEAQTHAFRGELEVSGVTLSEDRRTLRVTTDPHPMQAWYAITLPLRTPESGDGQEATIELAYDLSGVSAEWTPQGSSAPAWTGWLPHADLDVARRFTSGSAEHERLFELLNRPGTLRLATQLRCSEQSVTLACDAGGSVVVKADSGSSHISRSGTSVTTTCVANGSPVDLSLTMPTAAGATALDASEHTGDDPTERPLPLAWEYPSWAPRQLPAAPPTGPNPDLAGGDWKRGEALFFSAEANCATCHTIRGKGGHIGPDLSNLVHRDAASVLRDIVDPNAAINPDHVAYNLVLKDGRTLSGLVRSEKQDRLRVIDSHATETVVSREEVAKLQASPISIMPEGYAQLGPDRLKDLIAFLVTSAPAAAAIEAPPPRTRAEVDAVLGHVARQLDTASLRELRILLVAGPKDHGPGEHDYPAWQTRWKKLLAKAERVEISTAFGRPEPRQWEHADLIVFYCWGPQFWDSDSYKQLDGYLARGGGLVLLHSAVISAKEPQQLAKRIGFAWVPEGSKYRHGAHDLTFTTTENPITRGFSKLQVVDEDYWPLEGKAERATVLATTPDDGGDWPMLWTHEQGKGRIFCTILGHYLWTFDDPLARLLILRGMAYAAGEPAGRLEPLATNEVEIREAPAR